MSDVLLLSGGIDSIALAAWYRPALCVTVDYGQIPARAEVAAATQVCVELQLEHTVLRTDVQSLGSGDLAGHHNPHSEHSEFWPFRNQYLITLAAMAAMRHSHTRVLVGTVASDKRHTDGSSAFLETLDRLLTLQEGGIRLVAPAAHLTSLELIKASRVSLETLCWAHSCHISSLACGQCNGCQKHSNTMANLGLNR